ncbi:MAG: enolase C-terminal domain-like protein [Puniceicoccaceae bacterium]
MKLQNTRYPIPFLLLLISLTLPLSSKDSPESLTITELEFVRLTAETGRSSIYLTAKTSGGHEGIYGPIDWEAALIADKMMKGKVIGRSALAHEAIWNDLFKANRHYRGSHYLIGMSAIDNVLWDLKGKIFNQPVYKLLGGDRKQVQVYGSCLGYSTEPEELQKKVRELKKEGFTHQKWFIRNRGPEAGPAGLAKNVEMIRLLREAMGPDGDIMIDVFSTWNLNYAAAWCKQVEKYNLRWFEESLPSANLDGYIELSQETSVPLATGEHFYTRYDVQQFLERDAIRVVQADPEWCGGVSELVKICNIASVHGAQVVPHGHSLHAAMHVVASQDPQVCPLVEYLIRKMTGPYYQFEKHQYYPENGMITLPDRPGFGIELDESKIAKQETISWRDL